MPGRQLKPCELSRANLKRMHPGRRTFTGHIAGCGTRSGARLVIGCWAWSPFGSFNDVMLQTFDGERILYVPSGEIADFVSATYHFDRIEVMSINAQLSDSALTLSAAELDVELAIGGPAAVDWVLRFVPAKLATATWWLQAIDPVVCRILSGVHTAGTTGNGRREFYGVHRSRQITAVTACWNGSDLGALAPLYPPVQFGFSSAPATPQIVSVTTMIDGADD